MQITEILVIFITFLLEYNNPCFPFIDKAENGNEPLLCSPKDEVFNECEGTKKEETVTSKTFDDVVNVSEGFQLRTVYKKKVKPSKLDGLLERRVKQFTMEEKHRLDQMRQASFLTKTAASKPTVKSEGSNKQPSAVNQEDKARPQVRDPVVKKLDFEQEQTEKKADTVEVRANSTAPKHLDNNALENRAEVHKEVNGGPLMDTELSSKYNCLSDPKENKDVGAGVNAKKRGYEEMVQKSKEFEPEGSEPGQNSSVQMNGSVGVNTGADSKTEPVSQTGGDVKEPVLINGNLHNDSLDRCDPPPTKVLKLENNKHEAVTNNNGRTDSEASCPNTGGCSSKISGEEQPPRSSEGAVANSQASSSTAVAQKVRAEAKNTSMMISKEYSTRDRVSLLKFSKSKKARSGTALPSYRKFVTKSSKKSIFILPNDDLKRLARRGSIREVPIFSYSAKPALDIWPYPSPRPTFGITWRLVLILSHQCSSLCQYHINNDSTQEFHV